MKLEDAVRAVVAKRGERNGHSGDSAGYAELDSGAITGLRVIGDEMQLLAIERRQNPVG